MLIYGPDRGLVLDYYDKITQYFNKDGSGLAVIDYDAKKIDDDPSDFFADCISDSFFGDKKLVRVKDAGESFFKIMEDLLKDPISSFVVVTSDNLPKSSKLRAFFEKNNFCDTLACYQDNQKSIMDVINNFFLKKRVMINLDTKNFIASHLGENRAVTMSELEKLSIYIGDKKEVCFDDAKCSLCAGEIIEIDDFIYGILEGNFARFLKAQDKFLNEGTSPIMLIRSLINHVKVLYQMRAEFDKTGKLLESIKKINPRVFFKNQDNYMKQVRKFNCKTLTKLLEELFKAEKNLKSSALSGIDEVYGKRFFLTLSYFCKSAVA
ncbi:MAG: DNA polymerase III subunit delta [Rickettsiales bacterium]|nr:DNA polymerase III subunit delta [Rickettsiales bacterium]